MPPVIYPPNLLRGVPAAGAGVLVREDFREQSGPGVVLGAPLSMGPQPDGVGAAPALINHYRTRDGVNDMATRTSSVQALPTGAMTMGGWYVMLAASAPVPVLEWFAASGPGGSNAKVTLFLDDDGPTGGMTNGGSFEAIAKAPQAVRIGEPFMALWRRNVAGFWRTMQRYHDDAAWSVADAPGGPYTVAFTPTTIGPTSVVGGVFGDYVQGLWARDLEDSGEADSWFSNHESIPAAPFVLYHEEPDGAYPVLTDSGPNAQHLTLSGYVDEASTFVAGTPR